MARIDEAGTSGVDDSIEELLESVAPRMRSPR